MLILELAIVVFLTVVNGLLAMSELAIVSSRPARLKAMIQRDVVGSRRALTLASDPGKFLSTVQIGITLVGVLSGAFSGATLGSRLGAWLGNHGVPAAWADAIGLGTVVAAITYGSLIIGELVPKQIALRDPEAVAVKVAPAMTILAKVASPLVWLLDASGKLILALLGQRGVAEEKVTEEELRTLIAEAETAGVIEPGEREMIAGVMRLGDRPVRGLMTPRRSVDMINLADSPEDIRRAIVATQHTRMVVRDGDSEQAVGVIQAKDVLDAYLAGSDTTIRRFLRQAPVIPDTADALDAVAVLRNSPVHIGLVHDEYGHFQGVVTNADILEAIVGAFRTEDGPAEPMAVARDDGSLLVSGSMPIDELADLIGLPLPPDRSYHTVAGFALEGFRHLPRVGESFAVSGWRFEVVDLDGRRVDKLLVAKLAAPHRAVG